MPNTPEYQPLEEYKNKYKELHIKNVSEFFEDCVKTSRINESANKKTVEQINQLKERIAKKSSSLSKNRTLKGFLIFIVVSAICVFAIFGIDLYNDIIENTIPITIATMSTSSVLSVILILLIKKRLNPIIRSLDETIKALSAELNLLITQAWEQMRPLIELFNTIIPARLSEKTYPLIKLDDYFDIRRFDYLNRKFGLWNNTNKDISTLFVQSGEINGNPFCFFRTLNHYMSQKNYSGSKTIYWTESYVDNQGKKQTRSRSETLRATVTKPYPDYYKETFLVYGNEAAPNLVFLRKKSKANTFNEKQLENYIKSEIKSAEEMMRKKISRGENYTVMGNAEFESLFGASNRNNEVEFRLLFTPIAQREMLNLIKDKNTAWGDNFDFNKNKMLNIITAEHLQNIDLSGNTSNYIDYDVAVIRSKFNSYNNLYFKSIYFAFAPLLAIPLYKDHKTHEFIYKDVYNQHYSNFEHERTVNKMESSKFASPQSVTENILKTNFLHKGTDKEIVNVTAHGFCGISRIDYVRKYGGDGNWHSVPVDWIEYFPVSNSTNIDLLINGV